MLIGKYLIFLNKYYIIILFDLPSTFSKEKNKKSSFFIKKFNGHASLTDKCIGDTSFLNKIVECKKYSQENIFFYFFFWDGFYNVILFIILY